MHIMVGNERVKLYLGDELLIGDNFSPSFAQLKTTSPPSAVIGHATIEEE